MFTTVRVVHCHSHNTGGHAWFWTPEHGQKEYDHSVAQSDKEGFDWKIFMHDFAPEALKGGVDVKALSKEDFRALTDAIDTEMEATDFETREFIGSDKILAKNFEGTLIIWDEE